MLRVMSRLLMGHNLLCPFGVAVTVFPSPPSRCRTPVRTLGWLNRTCIHCPDIHLQLWLQHLLEPDGVGVVVVLGGHRSLGDGVTSCQHCEAVEGAGDAVGPWLDLPAWRGHWPRGWGKGPMEGRGCACVGCVGGKCLYERRES